MQDSEYTVVGECDAYGRTETQLWKRVPHGVFLQWVTDGQPANDKDNFNLLCDKLLYIRNIGLNGDLPNFVMGYSFNSGTLT